jgi:hypothetical protein
MRRPLLLVLILVTLGAIGAGTVALLPSQQKDEGRPIRRAFTTEQQWIKEDITGAIAGMLAPGTTVDAPTVIVDHVWSPGTYVPVVERLLRNRPRLANAADEIDFGTRTALTHLKVDVLLDQNERISGALRRDMLSASGHESAALLVGAFALRESVSLFRDVRPAMSRMTAHLSIAQALRGSGDPSNDGRCALVILTTLAGLERRAMQMVDGLEQHAASDTDRTWARALRLRITGDWRGLQRSDTGTLLVQLEYARAVRARLGTDAFLNYVDTLPKSELTDWHRIALESLSFTIEAGNRFTPENVDADLLEASTVWSRLHGGQTIDSDDVIKTLNDRPSPSPVVEGVQGRVVQVLDWGTWAAFEQRQLAMSLVAVSTHLWGLGANSSQREWHDESEARFGHLTLYPIALRWGAPNAEIYTKAMTGARRLVENTPELVTAEEWDFLLKKSGIQGVEATFPLEAAWFTPAVPDGTAFDLEHRSLRAGCPRPPTKAQAATWAREQPYQHWTVWANEYLALDRGKPSLDVIRRAFGSLTDYDEGALLKIIDFMDMTDRERIAFAGRLCEISSDRCDRLAQLLLISNRDPEAASAYERWVTKARDRVGVSNGVTWIVRYHFNHGRRDRAEEIARLAADTGSASGLEVLGEFLDRTGRYAEAETLYREIDEHYDHHTVPLGRFLMRQSLRTGDLALEAKAGELLRPAFPGGLQRVVMHALPVTPDGGIQVAPFGPRAMKTGLRADDVVIGIDGWRVHDGAEYQTVSRLAFNDTMTLTIWRSGRYQELKANVPERWFGSQIHDYRPPAGRTQ